MVAQPQTQGNTRCPDVPPHRRKSELSLQIDQLHAEIDHYTDLGSLYEGQEVRYRELKLCCWILVDSARRRLAQLERQIPAEDCL